MINSEHFTALLPFPDKCDRKIWVYVPRHEKDELLPVIYMTDGQNLFDKNASAYGCWEADKAVDKEMENGFGGSVIVGIDNGNAYRDSELTPKCIGEIQHREMFNDIFTPQGEIFDGFLMNTVIPYVESHFPVKTEKRFTALCGSSSGGLQAFFSGMEHPEKFGFIGALSPAFSVYKREDWFSYLIQKISGDMPYLYIYCGCGDELEQQLYKGTEMMYDLLTETGYPYERMNEVILFENAHNEKAWREIFPDFLHTFLNLN